MANTVTAASSGENLSLCINDWLVEFSRLIKDTRLIVDRNSHKLKQTGCTFAMSYDEDNDAIKVVSRIDSYPGLESSVTIKAEEFASILERSMIGGDFIFNLPEMQVFFNNQIAGLVKELQSDGLYILSDVLKNSDILILRNDSLVAAATDQSTAKVPLLTIGSYDDGHSLQEHSVYINYHSPENIYFSGDDLFSSITGIKDENNPVMRDIVTNSDNEFKLVFFSADAGDVVVLETELTGPRLKIKSVSVEDDFLGMKSAVAESFDDLSALVNIYADRLGKSKSDNWLNFLD